MTRPIQPGDRSAWENMHPSFDYDQILASFNKNAGLPGPTMARVAGYSLEQVDPRLGQLGNPIGIASYKPYQSTGEDFLHNYLGMIGIPIDLRPEFPTNANIILLTESAKFDKDIVAKIKNQLCAGKSVVITSGLLHALQGRGIEDIVEAEYTDRKVLAHEFSSGFGAGNASRLDRGTNADILFPQIVFFTNDAWSLVRAEADGNGFPLLFMDRYSKGVIYVLTVPENFNDLYALPSEVTTAIKNYVLQGFPVRLDGLARVALFPYDNHTFIVESYLSTETDVKISITGEAMHLDNLVTGEILTGQAPVEKLFRQRQADSESKISFTVHFSATQLQGFSDRKIIRQPNPADLIRGKFTGG